ncbi:MAG: HDOD domain-containing protein [Venatoribacter sp.]
MPALFELMPDGMRQRALLLLKTLQDEIKTNRLVLPTLPDVAIKVKQLTANNSLTLSRLENEILKDPGITARIMKVANSSVMLRGRPATSLNQAISSLGLNLVNSLVTQILILQTFEKHGNKQQTQVFINTNLTISAICHSLAELHPHLDPELAALAGLLHDVGRLPLGAFLAKQPNVKPEEYRQFEHLLHCAVGSIMLRQWHFSEELISVARFHEQILRDTGNAQPDYIDIVIAANILHHGTHQWPYQRFAKQPIPALSKSTLGTNRLEDLEKISKRASLFSLS